MKSLKQLLLEQTNDKNVLVWIDDLRNPRDTQWKRFITQNFRNVTFDDVVWCHSYDEFMTYMNAHGIPRYVSFDHDLADTQLTQERTGYTCAKSIIDACLDANVDVPQYAIQSSNPVGARNIASLMDNYHKMYVKTNSL